MRERDRGWEWERESGIEGGSGKEREWDSGCDRV